MIFLSGASSCSNEHVVFCKGKHSKRAVNYLKLGCLGDCKQQPIDSRSGSAWDMNLQSLVGCLLGNYSKHKSDPLNISQFRSGSLWRPCGTKGILRISVSLVGGRVAPGQHCYCGVRVVGSGNTESQLLREWNHTETLLGSGRRGHLTSGPSSFVAFSTPCSWTC